MKRREALQAIGAAALSSIAAEGRADGRDSGKTMYKDRARRQPAQKIVLGNGHFLSRTNPTATVDQRDAEALALRLQQSPAIINAKVQAAQRFRAFAGHALPAEAMRDFDAMMDEWAFHYTLIAMNSDPGYPQVICGLFGPPHQWFGMKVPASHGPATAENVDVSYSFIPVDGRARYELHGQRLDPPVGDCPIYAASNLSMTINVDSISLEDTHIDPDGSFVITIGPEPANGRSNHLQTTVDTRYVYTRDARVDWRQVPNAYRIHRLDLPLSPPMTVEQKTALAARFIVDDVGTGFMFQQMFALQAINTVTTPEASTSFGGQTTQRLSRAHIRIADDEAFVITVNPGGAGYHVLTANTMWLAALDYWDHLASLNNTQSIANADGSTTYVVSIQDPGVHNWIDTVGLHETLILVRYQLLPHNADGSTGGHIQTSGQLVKLKDLDGVLPSGTRRVTAAERQQQLAERLDTFKRRFVDH